MPLQGRRAKMTNPATFPRSQVVLHHGNADLKPRTQRSIMRDAGLIDADL